VSRDAKRSHEEASAGTRRPNLGLLPTKASAAATASDSAMARMIDVRKEYLDVLPVAGTILGSGSYYKRTCLLD